MEKASNFAEKCRNIAENYKTIYVLGAWGWPMTDSAKARCLAEQAFNRKPERQEKIMSTSQGVFGFDCVGLIKGVLWGWDGSGEIYGGAGYAVNGVPDKNADQVIALCREVSADFGHIQVGEVVWFAGHIGVYVGDGLVVECTHRWSDGVQLTRLTGRGWQKHGKLPWVEYEETPLRTLRKGDTGEDVRALQILLAGRGCKGKMFEAGYGSFGGNTEGAVKLYQQACGLPVTGVADMTTWLHLLGKGDGA